MILEYPRSDTVLRIKGELYASTAAGTITVHSVVAPSGELYVVKAGVVCLQVIHT